MRKTKARPANWVVNLLPHLPIRLTERERINSLTISNDIKTLTENGRWRKLKWFLDAVLLPSESLYLIVTNLGKKVLPNGPQPFTNFEIFFAPFLPMLTNI